MSKTLEELRSRNGSSQATNEKVDTNKIKELYSANDSNAKRILSNKHVLAYILKDVVKEFKDMEISDIIPCIEDVHSKPVMEGLTNCDDDVLKYLQNKVGTENEGIIEFDVLTKAGYRNVENATRVIINVEPQNKYDPGYPLSNRALFYACRLISTEKQIEFMHSEYEDIIPVYSIWVCMNRPEPGITILSLEEDRVYGNVDWSKCCGLLNIVCICLADDISDDAYTVIKLLSTIFSKKLSVEEKDRELNKYGIDFYQGIEKELKGMKLSNEELDAIILKKEKEDIEKGKEIGKEIGEKEKEIELIKSMYDRGIAIEDIAACARLSQDEVLKILGKE